MIRVVDASVAVKWLAPERGSEQAAALMRQPVVAPETLVPECLGALRRRVQRGLMVEEDALDAASLLGAAGITFESVQPLARDIISLSLRLSLSTYDCSYLALARQLDAVLVTADERVVARCGEPDAVGLGLRVRSLFDAEPPMVRERAARAYMPRRKK